MHERAANMHPHLHASRLEGEQGCDNGARESERIGNRNIIPMNKLNRTKREELGTSFQIIDSYEIKPETEEEQGITMLLLSRSHSANIEKTIKGVECLNKKVMFVTNVIVE